MTDVLPQVEEAQGDGRNTSGQPVSAPAVRLRRVNPIPGMMIDVETWRTAHDYHRDHARLHHRALHGSGIVTGLDVLVGKSVKALLIQPGVAVDPAGNFVIIDQEQVHRLTSPVRGTLYLALRYRDAPVEPSAGAAGLQTRVLESFSIEERTLPPTDNDVELARIDYDPQLASIGPAKDPQRPGRNEVDTRWRVHIGVANGAPVSAPAQAGGEVTRPHTDSDLPQRLDLLDRQVQQLAAEIQAAPPPDAAAASQLDAMHERLDNIAGQIAQLWQRPQSPTITGAEPAVSDGALDLAVFELRQRFEGTVQRMNDLGEKFQVFVKEREESARQQQVLADQIGSLVRQADEGAPELAQMRDGLDRLTLELERLASSVEPLEHQLQQLADQSAAAPEPTWPAPDSASGGELRLAIGRLRAGGWDQHREGLRLLTRELVATVQPLAQVLDEIELRDVPHVELLYLTGYATLALDESEIQGIARVLQSGGVVLAEGCAAGPSGEAGAREFAFSFIELAQRLGRRLTRVERGHQLLEARYVFGDPPAGVRPARVLEADGMIYSDADYGCAWQGGTAQQVLARSAIRDAFEFGVNMAIYHQARG